MHILLFAVPILYVKWLPLIATKGQELVVNFSKWLLIATWQPSLSSPVNIIKKHQLVNITYIKVCNVFYDRNQAKTNHCFKGEKVKL